MKTSTVNISFKENLLEQIDKIAQEESRTRSELIREAARLYIERSKKWEDIFNFGNEQVLKQGLLEEDINKEIKKFRLKNRKRIE